MGLAGETSAPEEAADAAFETPAAPDSTAGRLCTAPPIDERYMDDSHPMMSTDTNSPMIENTLITLKTHLPDTIIFSQTGFFVCNNITEIRP
jgi:hypothetical protein